MMEILIQTIPIYSMSEDTHYNKWKHYKNKCVTEFQQNGHTKEESEKGFNEIYYPQTVWKYNQVIGYIEILVSKQDVIFEKYFCNKKEKFYFKTTKKYFIEHNYQTGNHFYAADISNKQIVDKIREWLKIEINKNKKRYYDLSEFNNIIDYLDIKSIMKNVGQ